MVIVWWMESHSLESAGGKAEVAGVLMMKVSGLGRGAW